MASNDGELKSFTFESNKLRVLDQRLLPSEKRYIDVPDTAKGFEVIKEMVVRGAPCISAVACLSLVAELNSPKFLEENWCKSASSLNEWILMKLDYLLGARPTAVNLKNSVDQLLQFVKSIDPDTSIPKFIQLVTDLCVQAIETSRRENQRMAEIGAEEILKLCGQDKERFNILTHCNTGSLATVGGGTAFNVIKQLSRLAKLERLFFTETRPYNQGSRLTGFECAHEGLPGVLLCDNMVAHLMSTQAIDAVVVGADRIYRNGDVTNKIGTLQISIIAKHFSVPVFVVAPSSTIDWNSDKDSDRPNEIRPNDEVSRMQGLILAPQEIPILNPAFDLTPSELICRIITESGVMRPLDVSSQIYMQSSKKADQMTF